jgi:hypothetical protein
MKDGLLVFFAVQYSRVKVSLNKPLPGYGTVDVAYDELGRVAHQEDAGWRSGRQQAFFSNVYTEANIFHDLTSLLVEGKKGGKYSRIFLNFKLPGFCSVKFSWIFRVQFSRFVRNSHSASNFLIHQTRSHSVFVYLT